MAKTFTIGFPRQLLSGTYTIQLGPNIQDEFGDGMDATGSAGVERDPRRQPERPGHRGQLYARRDLPKTIPASTQTDPTTNQPIPGSVSSSIVVPDSYVIPGDKTAAGASVMQVQLNLAFAADPDLAATLYHYDPDRRRSLGR